MFGRTRPGGNSNYTGGRNNMMNVPNPYSSANNSYNQQVNYQQNIPFKQGISINEPFKPTPLIQPQSTSQPGQGQSVAPRLKPILKSAPASTNSSTSSALPPPPPPPLPPPPPPLPPSSVSESQGEFIPIKDDEGTSDSDVPRWKRNKTPGVKVNRKLKRLRMNQRLKKTLMPKNAIMVLNELKAGVQLTFPETQMVPNGLFVAHAKLDGKTYVGQGLSKLLARQNAAENALKSLLLEKMTAAAMKEKVEEDPDGKNKIVIDSEGTAMDTSNVDDADDVPWSSVASFALHKLFLEWQNSGTVVPIPRPGVQQPTKIKTETKAPTEKKLPANAETVHPVMLLNQMRPGTTYMEVSRVGNPPNTIFTLSVELDGKCFSGEAKNKKDAKKAAAKAALQAVYGLQYPVETADEVKDQIQKIAVEPIEQD